MLEAQIPLILNSLISPTPAPVSLFTLIFAMVDAKRVLTRRFCNMFPARRIEDRIRLLCTRVAFAPERELVKVLCELQSTIHEYTRRAENRISASVLTWRTLPHERHKA